MICQKVADTLYHLMQPFALVVPCPVVDVAPGLRGRLISEMSAKGVARCLDEALAARGGQLEAAVDRAAVTLERQLFKMKQAIETAQPIREAVETHRVKLGLNAFVVRRRTKRRYTQRLERKQAPHYAELGNTTPHYFTLHHTTMRCSPIPVL